MSDNKTENQLTEEEIKNADQEVVEIYYQQAIENFSWLSKKK